MRDPYEVLGVERRASAGDIKAAYRRLAKQCHPDRAPDDPALAEKFHEITSAYDFLRNERKRREYDSGEIDANGVRRRFGNWEYDDGACDPGHRAWKAGFGNGTGNGAETAANGRTAEDLHFKFTSSDREEAFRSQSIFSELFGNLRRTPKPRKRGADIAYRLSVSFEEAARGATRPVRLPTGERLNVHIPAGGETGQQIRLKGQGAPGRNGGMAGDALITIEVAPHPVFRREGRDIHMELDVSVPEAVLGTTMMVPGIAGPLSLTIPPGSNTGTQVRLEGKGIVPTPGSAAAAGPAGDHVVTLRVVLPGPGNTEFTDFVRRWARQHGYGVRGDGRASPNYTQSSKE